MKLSSVLSSLTDPSSRFSEVTAQLSQRPRTAVATPMPDPKPVARPATGETAKGKPAEPQALPAPPQRMDVHSMSPRETVTFAHDLYMEGILNWEEYRLLGFPSEMDPRYDEVIGSLTGEKADPDKPRDLLGYWEERQNFLKTYDAENTEMIERTGRIVQVLQWHDIPKVSLET